MIGQALSSASRTVEDVVCHSLHAYFLRPGDPSVPIVYEVDRARDGKSFQKSTGHGDSARQADFQLGGELST